MHEGARGRRDRGWSPSPAPGGVRTRNVHTRFCLRCGYSGPELQRRSGRAVFHCPGCDLDLYERPARSYAEIEGLPAMAGVTLSHRAAHLLRAGVGLLRSGRPLGPVG